mgnify:CR=1 FL=1
MNVGLCIAWFVFGMIVGSLILISIAVIHEDRRTEDGERISEQSNNNYN